MFRLALVALSMGACCAFQPTRRMVASKVAVRGWFDKKDDEPLNPDVKKQPSVWVASIGEPASASKKATGKVPIKAASTKAVAKGKAPQPPPATSFKARKLAKKDTVIDPYSGKKGGGNYGRSDYADVTDQDEASFLPDWLAGFFYDKSVGGPQRDVESIVATQLFFATFVLTPAVLGAFYYANN